MMGPPGSAAPPSKADRRRNVLEALGLWLLWLATAIVVNGTIPFLRGADLRPWSYSETKGLVAGVVIYWILFLTAPLVLVKGRGFLRQPAAAAALGLILLGLALRPWLPLATIVVVPALAFLHLRCDLSSLGFRSRAVRGDLLAVFLMASLAAIPAVSGPPGGATFIEAAAVALDRLFLNPASSIENLFYFGFLTERLAPFAQGFTAPLIGLMYVTHELANPEYWYEGMAFPWIFVAVTVAAGFYLWRRSLPVIWLADGLGRAAALLV